MSLEGQQIDRYRILRLLGSGGMGDVYLAEDARIEQQVAIKVIRAEASPYPDQEASQETARLFQREARAIVKLDHAHILPLYDYGEEHLGNMTVIYLVMPYRREGSLTDWLRQRGHLGLLSSQDVAHLVSQAASALQHAHDRQIIHQDVKPSNFLLRLHQETPTRPDLLLADFGIAKFSTATSAMSHTIRGTPTYMAPEQWEGHPVPATDQYGLAVMTYELLTGRPPFQGGERQVMYQHLMVPPPPPSTVNPHLSSDTDAVLLHALAKQPEQRFASMTAFATAFQQAIQTPAPLEADVPTYISTLLAPAPTPASQGDIRAVLAISKMEAQKGTTRMLTLPGGRRVMVTVPTGMRDGQIMRLDGLGEASSAGGPAGALILSILVKAAEDPPSLSTASATAAEATVLTAKSELALPSNPSVERGDEITPLAQAKQRVGVVPIQWPSQPPALVTTPPPRGITRRKVLVGLAALAVAGGGLTWLVVSQHPSRGTLFYTYTGHTATVHAVAWSPNGNRIASGSDDGTVQVWNAADGSNPYKRHIGSVAAVACPRRQPHRLWHSTGVECRRWQPSLHLQRACCRCVRRGLVSRWLEQLRWHSTGVECRRWQPSLHLHGAY